MPSSCLPRLHPCVTKDTRLLRFRAHRKASVGLFQQAFRPFPQAWIINRPFSSNTRNVRRYCAKESCKLGVNRSSFKTYVPAELFAFRRGNRFVIQQFFSNCCGWYGQLRQSEHGSRQRSA